MKTLTQFGQVAAVALILLTAACQKPATGGTSRVQVKMTDAPGDFQQVNVEVLEVKVHHSGAGWITLPTNPGVYDLLTLQNDVTATLVNVNELPAGQITQLRLVLGANNNVVVDDVVHPLATPSAQQSGLKVNLNTVFAPDATYELLLDFDAAQSIVLQGNGTYSLKPVIRLEGIVEL